MSIKPLPDDNVRVKRNSLRNTLEQLSKSSIDGDSETVIEYIETFRSIYSDGYRQMYSELYPLLLDITLESEDGIDCLTNNMEVIRNEIAHRSDVDGDLYGHILKLSDHISLESQRISESKQYESKSKILEDKLNQMYVLNRELTADLAQAREKINRSQIEAVSILAIFSAIVIAFSGGMGLIGNALTDLSNSNPWSVLFGVSTCGVVLFNTVILLINATSYIINQKDSTQKMSFKCPGWGFILFVNIIMIASMAVSLVMWS